MKNIQLVVKDVITFSKSIYGEEFVPLHRPIFEGNERKYLTDCIDSNFVSSVGAKVTEFEKMICEYTGAKYAIATVNGTSALHAAINLADVKDGDEVITQSLTFIATCNAISYSGASPIFIDVDMDTMGMSPDALKNFLENNAHIKDKKCYNRISGKRISACIPMHTFGFPCRVDEIAKICSEWNITLIEDIAESLGSFLNSKHTGNFAKMATLSFNGNKVITTGGGGMIITNDKELAIKAKHITTTAKVPHPFEFVHDKIGYNYRLPNINAALGCAQMENLQEMLVEKKKISDKWKSFFDECNINFIQGIKGTIPNFWLNAICLESKNERDFFLKHTNKNNVMTRPIWTLMSKLDMYKKCQNDGLKNSLWLEERIVNVPSSVPEGYLKNV